jgi:hypothetical protein
MKALGNPPPGIQASGSGCAVRRRALAVARRCSAARVRYAASNTSRPCLPRAVVPEDHSRRTAPPGTRCEAVLFVLRKTKSRLC